MPGHKWHRYAMWNGVQISQGASHRVDHGVPLVPPNGRSQIRQGRVQKPLQEQSPAATAASAPAASAPAAAAAAAPPLRPSASSAVFPQPSAECRPYFAFGIAQALAPPSTAAAKVKRLERQWLKLSEHKSCTDVRGDLHCACKK